MHQRNSSYFNGPIMSIAAYQWWEIRRYLLETETPGLFGYFTAADGA